MVDESATGARDSDPTPSSERPVPRGWRWTAWAEWAGWRGPPELVAQIARAALWAVSAEMPPPRQAMCAIELHVARDVERFNDPTHFREQVTPDGLRHFSWLDVEVRCGDEEVRVRLSPFNVRMGRPGVVLLASAAERARAERMRDTVAASIDRRTGRNRQLTGALERPRPLLLDLINHPSRAPAPSRPRFAIRSAPLASRLRFLDEEGEAAPGRLQRVWWAILDPFGSGRRTAAAAADTGLEPADATTPATRWARRAWQAILVVWAFGFVLGLAGDPDSNAITGWGSALVVACAGLGAAAWAAVRWIRPRVEVTPTSRLERIFSLAWKGLLAAAVSAAIGKSIELLLG